MTREMKSSNQYAYCDAAPGKVGNSSLGSALKTLAKKDRRGTLFLKAYGRTLARVPYSSNYPG